MTLNRSHIIRTISIACGLALVSACQQQNTLPAAKISPPKEAIVIALDLTQKRQSKTTIKNPVKLDVKPALTQPSTAENLETLLDSEQQTEAIVIADLKTPVSEGIIELHYNDQSLPAHLNQGITKIYQTPVAKRQTLLLTMAQELLPMDYAQSSARLLNQIQLDLLDPALLGDYFDTQAAAALELGDSFGAIVWLHQAKLLAPTTNPLVQQQRLALKAKTYEQNGLALGAAKALIELSQFSSVDEANQYNERIWSALTQLSSSQLIQQLTQASTQSIALAWYELALVPLRNHDLDRQLNALEQWRQLWPNHPAAFKLPGALANLADLSAHQPKKIALALPLQGRLGKIGQAVVDGFMAARYQATQELATAPDIKVYDTESITSLDQLYDMAQGDQIELIIGPLDKTKVIELAQKDSLSIPTLALNYVPITHSIETEVEAEFLAGAGARTATINSANSRPNLVQFGLAVEDEAEQLARRSLSEGHQRIIILHQDQPWAVRAASHFSQSWSKLGGEIASQVSFSGAGDHSNAITKALLIDQSHARVKALKNVLAGTGNSIKFEPRRRQDVDAIVLFALPTDGRQIVPTLAFHYAADLPVYASHHIYQGPTTTNRDRDLEKVIFTELPWLLDKPTIQQDISSQWPERMRYTRLFALGVDAYRLFPRLEQLRAYADSRVHGVTGQLQINNLGRIVTQSSWAQFIKGQVVPAPRYMLQP